MTAFEPGTHLGDLLSGMLDGEITQTAVEAAQAHLAVCVACMYELENVRTARMWVRDLPQAEPPSGFYERILRGERPEGVAGAGVGAGLGRYRRMTVLGFGHGTPSMRRKVFAFAGSAAAAVALVTVAAPRQSPVSPSVNRMVEAHATGASLTSDPLSRLAPLGVPVSFRK